eukprot:6034124-Pyramimonas_sp.AAC.1
MLPRVGSAIMLPRVGSAIMLPQEAQKELSKYSLLVLVDTPRPVAMFGYRGGIYLLPSSDWSNL